MLFKCNLVIDQNIPSIYLLSFHITDSISNESFKVNDIYMFV